MPANMQKLLSAGSELMAPKKKASAPVTDVSVIDGPACVNPLRNLTSDGKYHGC